MEITVIGDDYEFKRDVVSLVEPRNSNINASGLTPESIKTTSNIHGQEPKEYKEQKISTTYKFDKRLKQSAITK